MAGEHETKLILDAIDRVEDKFDDTVRDFKKILTKHDETMYGNGRPGLTTTVELIEKDVHTLNTIETKRQAFRNRIIGGILITVLGGLVLAGLLYKTHGG